MLFSKIRKMKGGVKEQIRHTKQKATTEIEGIKEFIKKIISSMQKI